MDQRLLRILGGDEKQYPKLLERDYPRVFGKIMSLWDTPESDAYFLDLMVDQRGDRVGFPPAVATEILHLSTIHARQHKPAPGERDMWGPSETFFDHVEDAVKTRADIRFPELDSITRQRIEALGLKCSAEGFLNAVEIGHREAAMLFADAGVNFETRNEQGWTAIMVAAFHGQAALVELFSLRGADVHARDIGGNTALHWAAFSGQEQAVQTLIQYCAELNPRNDSGATPLMLAVAHRHLSVVLLLIARGADLNAVNREGISALHQAASMGYVEIIRPLLAQGANKSLRTTTGETAFDLANRNGHVIAAAKLAA